MPRKCSATNRLITAKDHASVQINIAEVDESGKITGSNVTYALFGGVRETGDADDSINRLVTTALRSSHHAKPNRRLTVASLLTTQARHC